MRNMKRLMAVAMLAVVATLGAQTAMANDGVLLSDSHKDGVLLSDNHKDGVLLSDKGSTKIGNEWDSVLSVIINGLTGVLLSD